MHTTEQRSTEPAARGAMRAIIHDGTAFRFAEAPVPRREQPDEVLVRVATISENRGEHGFAWEPGRVVGWDAAGTVVETSADGLGPAVGTRVATWGFSGAWAEYRSVRRGCLAAVPEGVGDAVAASIPVAGMTALQAIRMAGIRPGTGVAITGATGGVGHLAVQLAAEAGAAVTAPVRSPGAAVWLLERPGGDAIRLLDAAEARSLGAVDAVIDAVGGPLLAELLDHVRPGGRAVLVGSASGRRAAVDTGSLAGRRIDLLSVRIPEAVDEALGHLLALVDDGRLEISVEVEGGWERLLAAEPGTGVRGKRVYRVR